VLASAHAANPELVTAGTGLVAYSEDELKRAFDLTFDRRAAYECVLPTPHTIPRKVWLLTSSDLGGWGRTRRSLAFRSKAIVQGLFRKSRKWMTMLEEFDVYTNPMCLSSADDHPLGI
jgi:hypothetical protein